MAGPAGANGATWYSGSGTPNAGLGTTGSLGNSKSITIDTTAPAVSGVSASNANGSYKAGQTIHLQVNFSVPVNVTGSPKLALDTTPAESATYASGSGTSTLVFDYTVQAGDNVAALDYTGTGALTLNGGTIRDIATNDATLTLATPGRISNTSLPSEWLSPTAPMTVCSTP